MPGLYFIAIIPPTPIAEKVTELKEEMARRFSSKKALNSPPHLTIIPPFNLPNEGKEEFVSSLSNTVRKLTPFKVELKRFSFFENRRRKNPVIFIHPEESNELQLFYSRISGSLTEEFQFIKKENRPFAPHMTIAFKDLTLENFDKAWTQFKHREFSEWFEVTEIFLLEHKDHKWHVDSSYALSI